jgi:hypothetical protein
LPEGFDSRGGLRIFDIRRYPYYYGSNKLIVRQATSRLESGLDAAKAAVLQSTLGSSGKALTPRSYIAITERPEQVPLGLDAATETAGFHVVRGTW